MANAELSYGPAPEDSTISGHTPSLAPAVDITFSRPSASVKGSRAGLRFRKLRVSSAIGDWDRPLHFLNRRASPERCITNCMCSLWSCELIRGPQRRCWADVDEGAVFDKQCILRAQASTVSLLSPLPAGLLPQARSQQLVQPDCPALFSPGASGAPTERGQLLLSRAHSSNRKNGRQERVLSSQNDSSATALQSNVAVDVASGTRATTSRPSPVVATTSQHNNKGAADFRVQGLRSATPPAALTNSLPVINRHEVEDVVTEVPPARPIHRQRRAKLIRDPTNTCHRPRSHPSRLTQSMDFERSSRVEHRRNVLSQLFTCCTPVAGLFRRGTSYGTMQRDSNRQSSAEHQHQSTQQRFEEDEGTRQRISSNDDCDSIHERTGGYQEQRRLRDGLGQVRGSPSAADTAVAVGSLDDHTTASSKAPSTPSNGPNYVGPPDDTDDAAESDWLISRSDKNSDSACVDDLPSPGSGIPGIGAGITAAAAHSASQGSDPGVYNTASSEFDTEADDSVYRTPPTSLGDIARSSAAARRNGSAFAQISRHSSKSDLSEEQDQQVVPSETPANTMTKLYLGDETYEHVPRRLTVESSSADPESIGEDGFETDEEIGLRAEITSPPGNVATESSERLVTHVENQFLLPPLAPSLKGRKCLVLDLDETLVHSSFREVEHPDYVVPVVLEGQEHSVYVVKRPGVDEFISVMGQYYEVVVFTASLAMYADPVLDLLDKKKVMHHRLFRESCNLYNGNYVKDLSRLGRDITQSIIIDNSPASYAFHPNNAIGISTWLNDQMDTELRDLIPFLIDLTTVDDVSAVLSLTHNHASFAHD
ncbi:hypothetical protein H4S08_002534 [Coemansia sp. RSA 1365]|nr:hypothetical protein H4S08_002534 [Coemansia sp. RSA 1365]